MEQLNWGFPLASLFWLGIALIVAWEMAWKGVALWRTAGNGHLVWFIVIFIFNTLGILPIVYIFVISRRKKATSATKIGGLTWGDK